MADSAVEVIEMMTQLRLLLAALCLTLALGAPAAAAGGDGPDEAVLISTIKILMYQEPCCYKCRRMSSEDARHLLDYLEGKPSDLGHARWKEFGPKLLEQLDKTDRAQADKVRLRVKKLQERTPLK
jgi:hypothetical protein